VQKKNKMTSMSIQILTLIIYLSITDQAHKKKLVGNIELSGTVCAL